MIYDRKPSLIKLLITIACCTYLWCYSAAYLYGEDPTTSLYHLIGGTCAVIILFFSVLAIPSLVASHYTRTKAWRARQCAQQARFTRMVMAGINKQ
jgi:hypothetical protein